MLVDVPPVDAPHLKGVGHLQGTKLKEMIVVKCVLYVLFFCLFAIVVHGQPKYKIEHYSTEQGLSHRRVNCMMKDREGFMWFGTWDGINRFDGHAFVAFKSSPEDKYQLGNSRIGRVVEDQSDHLWVMAYDYQ